MKRGWGPILIILDTQISLRCGRCPRGRRRNLKPLRRRSKTSRGHRDRPMTGSWLRQDRLTQVGLCFVREFIRAVEEGEKTRVTHEAGVQTRTDDGDESCEQLMTLKTETEG